MDWKNDTCPEERCRIVAALLFWLRGAFLESASCTSAMRSSPLFCFQHKQSSHDRNACWKQWQCPGCLKTTGLLVPGQVAQLLWSFVHLQRALAIANFVVFAATISKFAFLFLLKLKHKTFSSPLSRNRLKRPLGCEPADGLIKCCTTELIQPITFINLSFHCNRTRWNSCRIIFLLAVHTSLCWPSHLIAMLNALLSASWNHLACLFKKLCALSTWACHCHCDVICHSSATKCFAVPGFDVCGHRESF